MILVWFTNLKFASAPAPRDPANVWFTTLGRRPARRRAGQTLAALMAGEPAASDAVQRPTLVSSSRVSMGLPM